MMKANLRTLLAVVVEQRRAPVAIRDREQLVDASA